MTGNDGGQHHNWPHHNGAVTDPESWSADRELYDIAEIRAFEDRGDYLYVAGDATRAYSSEKLSQFTRQIVYLRPGTFVIFDRVTAAGPAFRKTWLLQAMAVPERREPGLVITNGRGRLFVQTLLPRQAEVELRSGDELYCYGGQCYQPGRDTGPAPQCRVEIAPGESRETDYFLHVLTATSADVEEVSPGELEETSGEVRVTIDGVTIRFGKSTLACDVIQP